jgi:putative flippase GtrA
MSPESIGQRLLRYRFVRFMMSSGSSAVVGAIVLVGCFTGLHMAAWSASIASFVAAGATSYVLYRRWTFNLRSRTRIGRELLPFGVLSLATLGIATLAAQLGSTIGHEMTNSRPAQSLVVLMAVIGVNVLAVPLRYLVCQWIFADQVAAKRPVPAAAPFVRPVTRTPIPVPELEFDGY